MTLDRSWSVPNWRNTRILRHLATALSLVITIIGCASLIQSANGQTIKFEFGSGSPRATIAFHRDPTASAATGLSLNALWLNSAATQGWAVGGGVEVDSGCVVLHYTPQEGWQRDKASSLTKESLNALWMNNAGTQGWAVGDGGVVLRYTQGAWHPDAKASGLTKKSLQALWLNDTGTQGWALGEGGVVLRYIQGAWEPNAKASAAKDQSLSALWLNNAGTKGWAAGKGPDGPVVLHYTQGGGWQKDPKANDVILRDRLHPLNAIWLNDAGTQGWAVTDGGGDEIVGSVVRYTQREGWHRDDQASGVTDKPLWALWMNSSGTQGWAAGAGGIVLRYTKRDGWHRDPTASIATDHQIYALRLTSDGTQGWAVGESGVILRVIGTRIELPTMKPSGTADLSTLQGTFRLSFQRQIPTIESVKLLKPKSDINLLNDPDYYELRHSGVSNRSFDLTLNDKATQLRAIHKGPHRLRIAADYGQTDAPFTVWFDAPFTITPPNPNREIKLWSSVAVPSFILLNVFFVGLATQFAWARRFVLDPLGANIIGLIVGKYLIINALIRFVPPIRRALFRDYRRDLLKAPALAEWRSQRKYVPPAITFGAAELDEDSDWPKWRIAIDYMLRSPEKGVWLVVGQSGLGKTALLENWTNAVLDAGKTPLLIRLNSNLSASAEATALMNQYGGIPYLSSKTGDVELADRLLGEGGFVILLDALNEDATPDSTARFVRRMLGRNLIVLTSQFKPVKPGWRNVKFLPVTLEPFGPWQLGQLLPGGWLSDVLKADYLGNVIRLPETSKLLARYIEANHKLPPSLLAIYEDLCAPIIGKSKMLNLEQVAWQCFCTNTDQFDPSDAVPADEICDPAVESGLLTRRQEGKRAAYRFAHERVHRYLVARYLVRQDTKPLEEWDAKVATGLDRRRWADVLEFWGAMIAETPGGASKASQDYRRFLKSVAIFEHTIFAERLYPQYERLRDAGQIEADVLFERWAASQMAKAIASAV